MRLILALFVAAACAERHVFTYVGFDHLLDYNPATGNLRAFDFRRHLPENEQCDIFVYPPLIEKADFIDAVTSFIAPTEVFISYLGGEYFLVQDDDSGRYTVRRCSGFMPQQTRIPCEVWAVGHDSAFLAPNRYFFAGEGRVIRFHRFSQAFDLLSFDADVHGGGFPFGKTPIIAAQFSAFPEGANVSFAFASIASIASEPRLDVMIALDEDRGEFKVWKYSVGAEKDISLLVGQLLMTGSVLPHFELKTMGEDALVAYDKTTGDFEIWRLEMVNGHLKLVTVKRDNIQSGHGCIFSNRQDCIASPQCGWCADSVTCHQLNRYREPCDGTRCLDIVDEYSSEHKKFQQFEIPIASSIREFGSAPAVNPLSPLRKLHDDSADPLLRDSDLEDEPIMNNTRTNPSFGVVFVPPKSSNVPCMDNEYDDPKTLPSPNIRSQEETMNAADGLASPVVIHSPLGEASGQVAPPCPEPEPSAVVKNVTKLNFPGMNATFPQESPQSDYKAPSIASSAAEDMVDIYNPNNDGTARESDLMNGVVSHYSSLMAKENDVAAVRPDLYDPPAPESPQMVREMTFKPREPSRRKSFPSNVLSPSEKHVILPYSSRQMESNLPMFGDFLASNAPPSQESEDGTQKHAMTATQFRSTSIFNAPFIAPAAITAENILDVTGSESSASDPQLDPRKDEAVVEGWAIPSTSLEKAQRVDVTVVAPEASVTSDTVRAVAEAEAEGEARHKRERSQLEALAKKQGIELPAVENGLEAEKPAVDSAIDAIAGELTAPLYDDATGQIVIPLTP